MTNRNPYEKEASIPDFIEKTDDIDMSVFKMKDEIEDDEYEDDDEYEEVERHLSTKGIMIIEGIVIAILLAASISGWIFAINQKNTCTKLEADYETVNSQLTAANSSIAGLNTQIADLQSQLAAKEEAAQEVETEEAEATYKMNNAQVRVRTGAGSKYDIVTYSKLSTSVQDKVYVDGSTVTTRENATFAVYETKTADDGSTWGRIDTNAWICLKTTSETYANKQ